MIPLWMTAILRRPSDRCGWAFRSVGPPWVAQRVWPIPVVPAAIPDRGRGVLAGRPVRGLGGLPVRPLDQRLIQVGELAGVLLC